MSIGRRITVIDRYALTSTILVCALPAVGGWTARIADVPGECHDEEERIVIDRGQKLDEPIARAIFPGMPGPYVGP